MEVLGSLGQDDFRFIKEKSTMKYTKNIQSMIDPKHLETKLNHVDPLVKDLLTKMLQFNPLKRNTAADCLKHPLFNSIRIPELEEPAVGTVDYIIDHAGAFNYHTGTPDSSKGNLTLSDYKKIFI